MWASKFEVAIALSIGLKGAGALLTHSWQLLHAYL